MTKSILDYIVAHDDVVATCGPEPTLRDLVFKYYNRGIDDKEKALHYAREYCRQIEEREASNVSASD